MKQKTRILIYILIAAAAVMIGVIAVFSKAGGGESALGHIDLGRTYLIELSYDKAVIEFTEAIRIDPMNVDAYLGLAEAYEKMGDMDKAIEWLEKGFEMTGDERVGEMLDRMLAKAASSEMAELYVPEGVLEDNILNSYAFKYRGEFKTKDEYCATVNSKNDYPASFFKIVDKNIEKMLLYPCILTIEYNSQEYTIEYYDYLLNYAGLYDDYLYEPKITVYDSNGNIIQRAENEYDSEKRLLKSTCYDNAGEMLSMSEYTYNKSGNIVGISNSDGSRIEFLYDVSDNRIKDIYYNSDGSVDKSYEYKYDEYNRRIERKDLCEDSFQWKYDNEGNVIEVLEQTPTTTRKYVFDKNGNLLENSYVTSNRYPDENVSYLHNSFYEYNDNGECIVEKSYGEATFEKSLYSKEFKYENERLVGEKSNRTFESNDGSIMKFDDTADYVYDQYGRIIESKFVDKDYTSTDDWKSTSKYSNYFTYDEYGNKIKMESTSDDFYGNSDTHSSTKISSHTYSYDKQGNIVKEEERFSNTNWVFSELTSTGTRSYIYGYDEHSNLINVEHTYTNSNGETSTKTYDINYIKIEIPKIFIEQIKSDYGIDITE